jgi:hypothetical protein
LPGQLDINIDPKYRLNPSNPRNRNREEVARIDACLEINVPHGQLIGRDMADSHFGLSSTTAGKE